MKCMHCSSLLSLIGSGSRSIHRGGCGHIVSGDTELTFLGSASPIPGTPDFSVSLNQIQCQICKRTPFYSIVVTCNSCSYSYHYSDNPTVRLTLHKMKTMIEEIFGQEIMDRESWVGTTTARFVLILLASWIPCRTRKWKSFLQRRVMKVSLAGNIQEIINY